MESITLELNSEERIHLSRALQMIPAPSTRQKMADLQALQDQIDLSDEERQAIEFKTVEGPSPSASCDRVKARALVKDITLSPWNRGRIACFLLLSELNDDLGRDYVTLFDKFCGTQTKEQ